MLTYAVMLMTIHFTNPNAGPIDRNDPSDMTFSAGGTNSDAVDDGVVNYLVVGIGFRDVGPRVGVSDHRDSNSPIAARGVPRIPSAVAAV